jgi:cell division protein FtsB
MEAETRKELWGVIQAFSGLYCCAIGTWAIWHPPGSQQPTPSNANTPWWYVVLLVGFGVCAATLTVGAIANIVARRRERTVTTHEPPKPDKADDTLRAERDKLRQENKTLEQQVFHFQEKFNQSIEVSGQFKAERDRLQENYDILSKKFGDLTTQFNQSVWRTDGYKRETDELYAEIVFVWLRDNIHSTGTTSAALLSQTLGLSADAVTRGLILLESDYHIVKQRSPNVDAWTFVAGATPFQPRFRIVPAVETDRDKIFGLAARLRRFLKESGPRPDFPQPDGMSQLDYIKSLQAEVGPWLQRLIAGYAGRFADDVQKARHLLAEHNVVDFELDGLMQSPKDENNILKIARKRTAMAAELDE